MKLSKSATYIVILTASVAFLGICYLQYQWITDSIESNRSLFYKKVDLLSNDVEKELIKSHASLAQTDDEIRAVIHEKMENYDINTAFTFGIYEHQETNFKLVSGDIIDPDRQYLNCVNGEERTYGWANLSCGSKHIAGNYHLGIFFPDEDMYMLSTITGSLIATLFFIILLLGCFSWTIITIFRQKKLSEMKDDFVNNLTHEFKTPIFSIDLASGLLKKSDEIKGSPQLSRYIEVIDSEGKRLKNQVDKVLQMALIDSGNFKLNKSTIDIHEIIEKVAKSFLLTIEDKKGALKLNLDAKNSQLYIDETHIKNIIYNLLDNATKYCDKAPIVEITTKDTAEGLMISLKDNGIGMDETLQQYVFDKFYRISTGDIHNVKGFGLGLSYVKSVLDAHNAKINLQSYPDKGSQFDLHFSV